MAVNDSASPPPRASTDTRSSVGSSGSVLDGALFTPQRASPGGSRFAPAATASSPSPAGSSTYSLRRSHNRKQSSISYNRDPSLYASPSVGRTPLSPHTPLTAVEEAESSPRIWPSPTLGVSAVRPGAANGGGGPATLLEQHGDLLSFIAKKERKCLDLREELKREEDELKVLKTKWETIVADSMRPPESEVTSPPVARGHGGQLPDLPAPPMPGAGIAVAAEALPDLNTAKRYLGGLMKHVGTGVSGLIENLAAPPTDLPDLGTVREEDEEDECGMSRSASMASSSDVYSTVTRDSSLSSIDSTVNSSDTARAIPPPLDSSLHSPSGSEDTLPTAEDVLPSLPPKTTGPPRSFAGTTVEKHARRRSAFDMFGQAASGFTSNIGRKLSEVAGSETFKTSKRATMNFVDTFERTLTDAIAIDTTEEQQQQPGRTAQSPPSQQSGSFWAFNKTKSQAEQLSPTPAPNAQLDWTSVSLLDGVPPAPSTVSPVSQSKRQMQRPLLDELDVLGGGHLTNTLVSPISPVSPTNVPIQTRTNRIPPRHSKRLSMGAVRSGSLSPQPVSPSGLPAVIEAPSDSANDDWTNW